MNPKNKIMSLDYLSSLASELNLTTAHILAAKNPEGSLDLLNLGDGIKLTASFANTGAYEVCIENGKAKIVRMTNPDPSSDTIKAAVLQALSDIPVAYDEDESVEMSKVPIREGSHANLTLRKKNGLPLGNGGNVSEKDSPQRSY